jgi:hypothetical protein
MYMNARGKREGGDGGGEGMAMIEVHDMHV